MGLEREQDDLFGEARRPALTEAPPGESDAGVGYATAAAEEAFRFQPGMPKPGIALCLSGGGYRAMLFHAGALWRLNHAGVLPRLNLISSVSGGSIVAGVLASAWDNLDMDDDGVAANFHQEVVSPLRALADRTIDRRSMLGGMFWFGSAGNRLASAYRRHLFDDKTLQDLPDEPRFVFNSTSLQSGVLWRFSKPYMADYRVGLIRKPDVPLATAVAASSAFPPFLSPLHLKLNGADFEEGSGHDLQCPPYTESAFLTDGGVYDNLGLEAAFKRYSTVLISDGGARLDSVPRPRRTWFRQGLRVLFVIDNQVRALRKRNAVADLDGPTWDGAYWGIGTRITAFDVDDVLPCDRARVLELARGSPRLRRLDRERQERLINWGYAICDAALRARVDKQADPPTDFPFPDTGV